MHVEISMQLDIPPSVYYGRACYQTLSIILMSPIMSDLCWQCQLHSTLQTHLIQRKVRMHWNTYELSLQVVVLSEHFRRMAQINSITLHEWRISISSTIDIPANKKNIKPYYSFDISLPCKTFHFSSRETERIIAIH